jgi:two-component system response regulator FlrC
MDSRQQDATAKKTVLIVDDEAGMRLALREVLRRAGWEALLAEDSAQALATLDARPDVALMITDFRMPGMNGLELLREARRRRPALRQIMMTAYGAVEDAVAAMRAGAADYLLKPFSMETVLAVVEQAMALAPSQAPACDASSMTTPAGNDRAASAPKDDVAADSRPEPIAQSAALRRVLEIVEAVAQADSTVLLTGESGVGKEVVARALHRASGRRGPFVAVNCAALPEGLLESELFGHEKGAFTGAILSRKGRFEQAGGGTLLLDEISETPLALQAKLLRVLQEKEISPVGSGDTIRVDARVVATTNRDLQRAVAQGQFRQDLYYRLHVIALRVPPLRERREDVLPLAEHFLRQHRRHDRPGRRFSAEALRWLPAQPWPGNARELENIIERACLLARGEELGLDDLDPAMTHRLAATGVAMGNAMGGVAGGEGMPFSMGEPITLGEMERRLIMATLARTGGNRTRAAGVLGVSVRTIRNKLNEYGVKDVPCGVA